MIPTSLILRGRHFTTGEINDYIIEEDRIAGVTSPTHHEVLGGEKYWVAPGLIDIQVNGYQGINFCSGEINTNDIIEVSNKLAIAGVTAFCPTLTTNSHKVTLSSLQFISKAIKESRQLQNQIISIHLEGPYLSREDGPRGAHPLEHIRNPSWEEFLEFQKAADGKIGIITIAPELPQSLEFINRATKMGVIVAIGHHAATVEQIKAAVDSGAVLCTHLGNGAHNLLPRHPNYLWEQLANDSLSASIIVDGFHLPSSVVKTIYRVKGPNRLILISDVVSTAGLPPGKYRWQGVDVDVRIDGSIRLSGTPYLAGSSLKLCDAIHKFIEYTGSSLPEAIRMVTENPARLLKVFPKYGELMVGGPANIIILSDGPRYELAYTIIEGKIRFQA